MVRDIKKLDEGLNRLFKQKKHPGIAVTIRGPEGVLFSKGYGFRDIEHQLPADENTIFGIASMSKSITALCCAILEAEGTLSLEDPITKYFPKLHIPGTPDECVTLRSIAMHRAGIPPMEPLEWSIVMNSPKREDEWSKQLEKTAPNKMDQIEQIVDYITNCSYPTLGMPGEYMSYSNEGYALLSYVVDQAAGISLEEFMQERIFRPLGMTRTVLDLDGSEARVISGGNMTSLFERDKSGNLIQDDEWSVLPPFRGCACVKSTSSDITRYYQMLSQGGIWEGCQVIPARAVELLIGRGFPVTEERPTYCLGLNKLLIGGRIVCEHSGGLHGVSTKGGLIEGGYSAAVLCNEGDVDMDEFLWMCYNYILGLPLEQTYYWANPAGTTFSMPEALVGDYIAREGVPSHCIVKYENGELTGSYSDTQVAYLYCGKTVFVAVDKADPKKRVGTMEFYLRDGKAWAVRCYTRIYTRYDAAE